jgi:hypothetical protein
MDQQGVEPSLKRTCTRPSYVRYFLSDGIGFILSLPPDIRRYATSERFWSKLDRRMVTMAHFDYDPLKTSAYRLQSCQEMSARNGSFAQFAHFSRHLPCHVNSLGRYQLQINVAQNGNVEMMQLVQGFPFIGDDMTNTVHAISLNIACRCGHMELMRYLSGSPVQYSPVNLKFAAVGGHKNAFIECMNHLSNGLMTFEEAWAVYKNLIRHGHLHMIEWLEERNDSLIAVFPGCESAPEMNWRLFNNRRVEGFFEFEGLAETVAVKFGQIHVLDWARKNHGRLLEFFSVFQTAVTKRQPMSIDWAFDTYAPSMEWLLSSMAHLVLLEALSDSAFDIAKHLFDRGVALEINLLQRLISSARALENPAPAIAFLESLLLTEHDPQKYRVETVSGRLLVQVRNPSPVHFKNKFNEPSKKKS